MKNTLVCEGLFRVKKLTPEQLIAPCRNSCVIFEFSKTKKKHLWDKLMHDKA